MDFFSLLKTKLHIYWHCLSTWCYPNLFLAPLNYELLADSSKEGWRPYLQYQWSSLCGCVDDTVIQSPHSSLVSTLQRHHWPLIVTRELGSDWLWYDSRTAVPATSAHSHNSLCTINIGINNVSGKSRSRLAVERDKPGTLISFHKVCLKSRGTVMSSVGVQCLHLLNKFQP